MFALTNTKLGRYEIREALGEGGMGEVYLAFDTRLRRRIALKILPQTYTRDETSLTRFRQEAFAASGLNHPNILTVYDIDVVDGRHIIATELVEGETLRKRLERGRLRAGDALAIALQMADALMAAHGAGVIHRDIKPENIMLRVDKYVKLLDFGIAKLTDGQADPRLHTLQGTIVGTPQYMSPEQARGENVDVRTDIWSFGVVLYEMLTGDRPFIGTTITEVINSILKDEPLPFSAHQLALSPDLEFVVRTMLSKEVESRYSQVSNLVPPLKQLKKFIPPTTGPQVQRSGVLRADSYRTTVAMDKPPPVVRPEKPARKSHSRRAIKTIAILPFVNDSSDQKAEYLSDGVTESIINNLSHLPQLRVMSRTSVFRFKGKEEDPKVIGRELGVAAVLTGRLLRMGSRVIIQAELVDVEDGSQIWGDRYTQRMTDVFKIQGQIAKEISEKLHLKLSARQSKRLSKHHTVNQEAYLSYLRGRFHWNKRSPEGLSLSIDYFKEAIAQDPGYALAYAGLADAYVVMGNQHLILTTEAYSRAKAAALRALEMDNTLPEAYTTLGFVKGAFDLNWSGSQKAFQTAIQLSPGYATAHQWYSAILRAVGKTDDAISEATKAYELDPLSPIINANLALCVYCARRYDEAITLYRRMLVMEPDFFWTHYGLALVYRQTRRIEEAITELQLALLLTKDLGSKAVVLADLAYIYGISDRREEANHLIEQLSDIAREHYVSPCDIAVSHLGIGDKDAAFQWLEKAYLTRDEGLMWLNIDPVFDNLRGDPRFSELLTRVGLA